MPIISLFDRALPTSSSFKQSTNTSTGQVNEHSYMTRISHFNITTIFTF